MKDHVKEMLDNTVETVLTALREIECDEVDTQGILEHSVEYVISQVLDIVYGSNPTDGYVAAGIVESVKHRWLERLWLQDTD